MLLKSKELLGGVILTKPSGSSKRLEVRMMFVAEENWPQHWASSSNVESFVWRASWLGAQSRCTRFGAFVAQGEIQHACSSQRMWQCLQLH